MLPVCIYQLYIVFIFVRTTFKIDYELTEILHFDRLCLFGSEEVLPEKHLLSSTRSDKKQLMLVVLKGQVFKLLW